MVLFLVLLVIILVILGIFAGQNSGSEDINFLTMHLTGVPHWLPPVVAGGGVAVLFLLYMVYTGTRHGIHRHGLEKRIGAHESSIAELQSENERLKRENADLVGRGPVAPSDGR